jgi:hypothetical protein
MSATLQPNPVYEVFNSCFPLEDGWTSRTHGRKPLSFSHVPCSASLGPGPEGSSRGTALLETLDQAAFDKERKQMGRLVERALIARSY